jgi:predicted  nucleic acid-binding Zn-ribbon protein
MFGGPDLSQVTSRLDRLGTNVRSLERELENHRKKLEKVEKLLETLLKQLQEKHY